MRPPTSAISMGDPTDIKSNTGLGFRLLTRTKAFRHPMDEGWFCGRRTEGTQTSASAASSTKQPASFWGLKRQKGCTRYAKPKQLILLGLGAIPEKSQCNSCLPATSAAAHRGEFDYESTPQQGGHGIGCQINRSRRPRVCNDQNFLPVRILEGDLLHARQLAGGFKPPGSSANIAREMRNRPVLTAARNLTRLGMNRNYPAAQKRPNVRPALFIERQVPSRERLTPVPDRLCERLPPVRPVGRIVGGSVVGTTFRPIQLRIGMGLVHFVHHFRRAHVSVKCDRIAVLAQSGFVELAKSPGPTNCSYGRESRSLWKGHSAEASGQDAWL
jgi:hypothetical protein